MIDQRVEVVALTGPQNGELAAPPLPRPVAQRRLRAASTWLQANALFVAGIAAIGVISLVAIPVHLNQDGWLALIAGRFIANHGIPQHDTLNVLTHGVRWVDQQWLAQLLMYELSRVGGLALCSLAYVGLSLAGISMAIAASLSLGGRERHVLLVLPVTAFLYFAGAFQIRTQGFAYPLFAATLWLLAADSRRPSRRAYLVFPLLVLWGNLHGSATLGVGLAVVYGLTLLVDDVRTAGWRRPWTRIRPRTIAFLLGSPLCLLVNPYGIGILKYYDATLLNSTFSKVVTEWQSVTSIPALAVPFFALALATVWLLGRSGSKTRLFDQIVLLVLAVAAISAVRNVLWFGLGVLILVPGALATVVRPRPPLARRVKLNGALAGTALVVLAATTVAIALRPDSWFERQYDQRAANLVAADVATHPNLRVFAEIRYSDWLLWHDPALGGHLAYDTRLELLSNDQILSLAGLTELPTPGRGSLLTGYGLLVLDPTDQPETRDLLARPGTEVILRGRRVVIATRPGA